MPRKLIIIFAFVFFLNFPQGVFANVLINEVMYDLDGGDIDWVEVYNSGDTEADLTQFKLLISNSTSNHSISHVSGSAVIEPGSYGVIMGSSVLSNYINKWGEVGNLFKSSFSLPNTGGKIEINKGDKLSPISSFTYDSGHGASGNGKSLQKISSTWSESFPTPSKENILSEDSTNTEQTEDGNTPTSSVVSIPENPESSITVTKTQKPTLKIISKNSGFVGVPMEFEARLESLEYKNLYAKYVWNFGDGSAVEFKDYENKKFSHPFYYAGDYLVSLEYYANPQQLSPDYIAKINIKIIHPNILISSIGDVGNFYVEITNTSALDVDLGEWVLSGNNKSFIFPKNTNLLSMKKIILSPRITNFTIEDKNFLELLDKNRTVIFSYKNIINQKQNTENNIVKYKNTNTILPKNNSTNDISPEYFIENYEEEFENHDISGAVILSDENPQQENNFIYIILFTLLIGLAVFSIYFLRKNRGNKEEENQEGLEDFEILDE